MEKLTGGQRPEGEQRDNLFLGLFGMEGVGKTTVGLSFPSPIMFVNCDRPAGQLISKLDSGIEIFYVPFKVDLDTLSPSAAQRILLDFDAAVRTAIAQCKSFFLDGEHRFLDIARIALLPEDSTPRDNAKLNSYMNQHYKRISQSGLQACISTGSMDVWTGAKTKTDRVDRRGFNQTREWMNSEMFIYVPEWSLPSVNTSVEAGVGYVDRVGGAESRTHWGRFLMDKLNERVVGVAIQNPTFPLIYKMLTGEDYAQSDNS